MIEKVSQLKEGSVISESSHYIINRLSGSTVYLDRIKASKKGIADWAKKTLYALMSNPIPKVVEGEDRVLRGYKVQFESRDGRYNCVDMDIQRTDKENGIRPVNILTIKWLIYNGVKYTVE